MNNSNLYNRHRHRMDIRPTETPLLADRLCWWGTVVVGVGAIVWAVVSIVVEWMQP